MEERNPEDYQREPRDYDVGRKRGEAYAGAHPYYEPSATAVTDIVVPATRIQWGPVFAGLLIALAVTFLFTSLALALRVGFGGLGYWIVGFGALGLFLGSLFAARTAKAPMLSAIMHGVIIWALVLIIDVLVFGSIGGGIVAAAVQTTEGAGPSPAQMNTAVSGVAWWFFGGFLVLLAAAILGGLAGMHPYEHEGEYPVAQSRP